MFFVFIIGVRLNVCNIPQNALYSEAVRLRSACPSWRQHLRAYLYQSVLFVELFSFIFTLFPFFLLLSIHLTCTALFFFFGAASIQQSLERFVFSDEESKVSLIQRWSLFVCLCTPIPMCFVVNLEFYLHCVTQPPTPTHWNNVQNSAWFCFCFCGFFLCHDVNLRNWFIP